MSHVSPSSLDNLEKLIKAAIGPNDPYPSAVQILAHQAKQKLSDRWNFEEKLTEKFA